MLALTPNAARYIAAARAEIGAPEDAALRIAPTGGGNELGLGFVDEPVAGDAVGSAHGVNYCVAPEIAEDLASAQLDLADDGSSLLLVPAG